MRSLFSLCALWFATVVVGCDGESPSPSIASELAAGASAEGDRSGPIPPISAPIASTDHPIPAVSLPTPELRSCLASVPHDGAFEVVESLAALNGEVHATWQVKPTAAGYRTTLRLAAGSQARTIELGLHAGGLYGRDLSACRFANRGHGPCVTLAPLPTVQGIVSEFSVQDWNAYLPQSATLWLLVRSPTSLLLLESSGFESENDPGRGVCKPGVWRKRVEIPVRARVVRETILVGDPPRPIDCTRAFESDSRCAG